MVGVLFGKGQRRRPIVLPAPEKRVFVPILSHNPYVP